MSAKPQIYALLGATGATGSAVLTQLLTRPVDLISINVYARSLQRLEEKFPGIQNIRNVTIFIGPMTGATLAPCLRGAKVIINSIGVNSPAPDITIARETAYAIVQTLRNLDSPGRTHMVYLSSASLCKDVIEKENWLQRMIVLNGLWYVYEDMRLAIRYYESEGVDCGLLYLTLACPGALMTGSSSPGGEGVRLSEKNFTPLVSYTELARGMIEMAEQPKQWQGKEVLLESAEAPAWGQLVKLILGNVIPGLFITFFPFLYPVFTKLGIL